MNHLKTTVFIAIIYSTLIKGQVPDSDDEVTIEDVNENTDSIFKNTIDSRQHWPYPNSENLKNRNERILWPKVGDTNENDSKGKTNKSENGRRKQRLLYSYPQSPIVDMMMQSVPVNYSPNNPNDPFDFLRDSYPLPKGYSQPLDEYDYVIIGAGSAGSVLAARLTEDKPRAMVLVIEAGRPEMIFSDIPALAHFMPLTDYAWQYQTERQDGICLGSADQKCFWPRGKAVGGTSVINYMIYTRGRPEDWDQIAADGNYGWSYNEVLEYYKKSERAELKKYKKEPYRGRDGELTVENVPFKTGLVEAFLAAGRSYGHPTVDYNSPHELGFGYVQVNTDRGHRMSAARAFLHPHKRRRNLHILPESRATKIIIEPYTKRAYAVDYIRNGQKYRVRCRREVIVSAGPIASPQLLMLSGIGPQQHLQSLGIPVIKDLQVGRTLYDHISFPGVIFTLNSSNASLLEPKVATLPNLIQWLQFGDGLMAAAAGVEGIGYIKTAKSDNSKSIDIELISLGASINFDSGKTFAKSWGLTDQTYNHAISPINGVDTWSAAPMLLHPKSKGCLELRDANPFSHPKMYGNYFADPKDMEVMIEAIKYVIKLGRSEAFRKYNPQLYLGRYHTCPHITPGSDEYWDCAVRTLAVSLAHQIATCKMGPPSDSEAVVDPELRVYGIEGLRVVDSSIIPRTVAAHTNAPAIMIGEKAADMIRRTWSNVVA